MTECRSRWVVVMRRSMIGISMEEKWEHSPYSVSATDMPAIPSITCSVCSDSRNVQFAGSSVTQLATHPTTPSTVAARGHTNTIKIEAVSTKNRRGSFRLGSSIVSFFTSMRSSWNAVMNLSRTTLNISSMSSPVVIFWATATMSTLTASATTPQMVPARPSSSSPMVSCIPSNRVSSVRYSFASGRTTAVATTRGVSWYTASPAITMIGTIHVTLLSQAARTVPGSLDNPRPTIVVSEGPRLNLAFVFARLPTRSMYNCPCASWTPSVRRTNPKLKPGAWTFWLVLVRSRIGNPRFKSANNADVGRRRWTNVAPTSLEL